MTHNFVIPDKRSASPGAYMLNFDPAPAQFRQFGRFGSYSFASQVPAGDPSREKHLGGGPENGPFGAAQRGLIRAAFDFDNLLKPTRLALSSVSRDLTSSRTCSVFFPTTSESI